MKGLDIMKIHEKLLEQGYELLKVGKFQLGRLSLINPLITKDFVTHFAHEEDCYLFKNGKLLQGIIINKLQEKTKQTDISGFNVNRIRKYPEISKINCQIVYITDVSNVR